MAPILAYWDIRGIVNPIRMLLAYAEVRYEDKRYDMSTAMQETGEWSMDKKQLGDTLDFPNLPYYIDGTVMLTQSKVILQYLGRKHGLNGSTDTELNRIALAIAQLNDLHEAIIRMVYPPIHTTNREEIFDKLQQEYVGLVPGWSVPITDQLARISKFLGANEWIAGSKLTYADFYVYDILDWIRLLFKPKHFETHTTLVKYMERVEALKGVKEFLASEKFEALPIFSQFALGGRLIHALPHIVSPHAIIPN